ncbi:two-component system sensor histidine kinase NtrB [Terrilactibacillus laevilacticus]|uniref:histidine kinase n=1 Tax=Terrilactibacillus laevilacticus TaxID=1380157 RepID=A0ABW5PTP2_9BACI|nr:ATP-binding protein [Terrilactibacillus laevilacticus]
MSSDTLVGTLSSDLFEKQLSEEIRYCILLNGKIIDCNYYGHLLIEEYGDILFDHVLEYDQKSLYSFIKEISGTHKVVERVFRQRIKGEIHKVRYRGILDMHNHILISGYIEKTAEMTRYTFPDIMKTIFNKLQFMFIFIDHDNQVLFRSDQFIHIVKTYEKENKCKHPFEEVIRNMALIMRLNKNNIERYHYLEDKLYHIYGIYHQEVNQISFTFNEIEKTDEFEKLIQYKQQMESVSQLAAGFAHELRNPLSVIRGFIQLSTLTNSMDKYYRTILSEIDRMNTILDDFLSLSRKSTKKKGSIPQNIIKSVMPLIHSECLLRNILLKCDIEPSTREINLEESMIKQVLLNILRNSVEAFEEEQENKTFIVEGKTSENAYTLIISDNGPGMEPSVLDQLGKPFFTTKANGTGIGLPMCKKIIKDHHGTFNINSNLGEGTEIVIKLPFV